MQNFGQTQPDLLSCAEERRIKTGTGEGGAGTLIRGGEGKGRAVLGEEAESLTCFARSMKKLGYSVKLIYWVTQ